ncbi:carbohydrate-binding module family 18 protein [Piromyces sp. E2]|nr:carbohydrate-binding module family 18 protein [Piromyces sp. E2]|eukprot:OUM64767.1 carbohydrate-binding module family 18 protein [Piromyces sp. E2]
MKNNNKILLFLINSLLLINITFAKSIDTSSSDDKVITKNKSKDQRYLIFVNNTYGEYDIFSNPYNQKYVKRQEVQSYDFAVSLMDEIDELINENRETFKNPEKLEKIENQIKLSKRDNEDQPVDYYDNSYFVHPILSLDNQLLISAYLSENLVKKIEKMKNVEAVLPDVALEPNGSYYNEEDILKESSWKDLTVQNNANLHLSVISQGLYKESIINKYDENYYYPSSAGKDIDIIIVDDGFDFDYSGFHNHNNRTVECSVYFNVRDKTPYIPKDSSSCGLQYNSHGKNVSDIAGGNIHGSAKFANIYGVGITKNENGTHYTSDTIESLQYVLKKMIRQPNKTVINMSVGSFLEKTSKLFELYYNVINEITKKGAIIVTSAGNGNKNVERGKKLHVPCAFNNTICVGGIKSSKISEINSSYSKSQKSNFGKLVDIYAPYNVNVEFKEDGKIKKGRVSGTSFSSPLTAGIIATIMSDNSNTVFTTKTMLKHLLDSGIPFTVDGLTKKVVNNGKHIVYSSNGQYNGCGISAGNTPCSETSNPISISTVKDRCGQAYGKCADENACCSSKGYCGTTSAYCGTGCQPQYGICN